MTKPRKSLVWASWRQSNRHILASSEKPF